MRAHDERGSITPLIVGFALFLTLGIVLVVDATAAYLQRQSLSTLADGAALQGADAGAEGRAYRSGLRTDLPVSADHARAAVLDYLADLGAFGDYPGLRVDIEVREDAVLVRLHAPLELPLTVPGLPDDAPVTGSGAAVTRLDE